MDRSVHLTIVAAFFTVFYSVISGPALPSPGGFPGQDGRVRSEMQTVGVQVKELAIPALLSSLAQIGTDQYWSAFNEQEQDFAETRLSHP